MAGGDQFLFDVAQRALLRGLTDPVAIRYRQDILADCLASPTVVREMYSLAVTAVERTFRISAGDPLPTSHGGDVYRRIFATDLDRSAALG